MTYIAPSSDIGICRGVPISNDYVNTLYFANSSAQGSYFISKRVYVFTDYSYQRVEKNRIRVSTPAENLYDCNYMYFRNENFGTKIFYAFITSVEYINNQCSEITYEIDEIQTWWFALTLQPCMVVRQHSTSDTMYSQCEPEDFDVVADYASWNYTPVDNDLNYILITSGHWVQDPNWPDVIGSGHVEPPSQTQTVSNVRCPVEISVHTPSGEGDYSIVHMNTKIRDLVKNGHEDAIIGVYCVPSLFGNFVRDGVYRDDAYGGNKESMRANSFQGYVPKNNKMYNYPFCMLEAQTPSLKQVFAIEDFRTGTGAGQTEACNFYMYIIQAPVPQLYLVPRDYQGQSICWEKALILDNFLQVPYQGDSFAMWSAQNYGGLVTGLAGSALQLAVTAFKPDPVGAAIGLRSFIETAGNSIGQIVNASQRPNNVYGMGGGVGLTNIKQNIFRLEYKTLNYWQARQVDSYFTRFGYKQGHVMRPNVHARQKWTYVQTDGCSLTGDLPSDSASFIKSCFNKGITFWADHDNVGNYSLENSTL